MNIDFPTSAQIPQLRRLWKVAFGDSDAWLDHFFSVAYSPQRCRCIVGDNTVRSTLYWFDICCDGAPMAYLYAVATDPAARKQGLCRTLLENTKQVLREQGYAGALLVPADDALRRMYAHLGFTPCTTLSEHWVETGDQSCFLRHLDTETYAQLRRNYLPQHGVLEEDAALALLAGQADFYAGDDFLCTVSRDHDRLFCIELLGNAQSAPAIVRTLGFDRGFFRFPGNELPFASFCPLIPGCPVPSYFGLALD